MAQRKLYFLIGGEVFTKNNFEIDYTNSRGVE